MNMLFANSQRAVLALALLLALNPVRATAEEAGKKAPPAEGGELTVEEYDVKELLDEPGKLDSVYGLVQRCVAPHSWSTEGGPAAIEGEANKLKISQTSEAHNQIRSLLSGIQAYPKVGAKKGAAAAKVLPKKVADIKGSEGNAMPLTIYPVQDLVGDDGSYPLEELLTRTVEPETWDASGGPGIIQNVGNRRLLVILNSADVHKRILLLLDGLRKFPPVGGKKAAKGAKAVKVDEWKASDGKQMQLMVYPVAGLIVPGDIDPLMEQIQRTASPASWDSEGGQGRICYEPNRVLLVVSNTAEVQAEVGKVLKKARGK